MSSNRCVYAFFEPAPAEGGAFDFWRPDPALIVIALVAGFGWIAAGTLVERALYDVIRSCC
jgi:hypothetical protein